MIIIIMSNIVFAVWLLWVGVLLLCFVLFLCLKTTKNKNLKKIKIYIYIYLSWCRIEGDEMVWYLDKPGADKAGIVFGLLAGCWKVPSTVRIVPFVCRWMHCTVLPLVLSWESSASVSRSEIQNDHASLEVTDPIVLTLRIILLLDSLEMQI